MQCGCKWALKEGSETMSGNAQRDVRILQSGDGDARLVSHHVFSGITLTYASVHMRAFTLDAAPDSIIEIEHCREGRLERMIRGRHMYIAPGDLSVTLSATHAGEYSFPTRHYHGISVCIDPAKAPECFSSLLEDVNVRPRALAERLCGSVGFFVLRRQKYIEHIFSELYSVPAEYEKGYLKLKVLELLLVLSGIDPATNGAESAFVPHSARALAGEVSEHLSRRLGERVTLNELSEQFHVSKTYLQSVFKGVYGVTVYSYIQLLKMQSAGALLTHSDRTVMDIAAELGYSNASKFSAVFSQLMGSSPAEYRKKHTVVQRRALRTV